MYLRTLFRIELITCALLAPGLAFTFLLVSYSPLIRAQGFGIESKSSPSVADTDKFVSLEGRFSVALPQQVGGFRPLAVNTPLGRATGDAYDWRMKEGQFTAGFVDVPQFPDDPEKSKGFLTGVRDGMVKAVTASNGKLVSEKPLALDKHPGLELKFEFFTGLMIQRVYVVAGRLYQTALIMKNEQRAFEAVAISVLDSFKILNQVEVAAALKEQAAKAEPSPLPQEPVAPRILSDAQEEGLHGRVKTVFTENQDLSGTWSVQTRKPSSMEYYNQQGNLTKRELYDYKGNLMDISVYGYIDGARVSNWKHVVHEYNPPPMMIASPPGEAQPKYDSRYANKYAYQYDDKKRLSEKQLFGNEGKLRRRYVYKYSGNQKEELVYSQDGSLNQRYLYFLDDKGNEVEETIFEARDGSIRSKYSYVYEFDAQGNWTRRTSSKWVTKDGRSQYEPESVYYRKIEYYK